MKVTKYRVFGRVQGVGFRFFVLQAATSIGVRGWVRNMADGSVQALVEGTGEQHRLLAEQLQQGPRWSKVTEVQTRDVTELPPEDGFQIRPDGV